MEKIHDDEIFTLKDFTAPAEKPFLVVPAGQTKEHTTFQVYSFLIEKFDKAYIGYPTIFVFETHNQGKIKVYMSASEVGARVADCVESLSAQAIITIERDGTLIEVHFVNEQSKEFDMTLLNMPIIGSC